MWKWLALSLLPPLSALAQVPAHIQKIHDQLLPLHEGLEGQCLTRAQVWQQQLKSLTPAGLQSGNLILYFPKHRARHNTDWTFHVAPAISDGGNTWVLEKSPYVSTPMDLKAWVADQLKEPADAAFCQFLPPEQRHLAQDRAEHQCYLTFVPEGAGNQPLSYADFIDQCALVIDSALYEDSVSDFPYTKQVEGMFEKTKARCQKKFPKAKFDPALFSL